MRAGVPSSDLHRRYTADGRVEGVGSSALIYLLQCLGFTINTEKTVTVPTQTIEFLGFSVNTSTMEPSREAEKDSGRVPETSGGGADIRLRPLQIDWQDERCQSSHSTSTFVLQTFTDGPDRNLEEGTRLCLSENSREELVWWDTQMGHWNGKTILTKDPELIIESDASTQGWGATCQGSDTGGPWSAQEKTWHINCLELLAALKAFVKNRTRLVKLDNMSAVAYINNQGGTVSKNLVCLTRDLWMWCLERNIHIQAQHLPGVQNCTADRESRSVRDRSDWKLISQIFNKINRCYGPLEVDLFASRLVPTLLQLAAGSVDAFLQDCSLVKGFANPLWSLIP